MRGLNFVIKLSSIFGNIGDMIKVKTIFISDVHLGSRACQADRLLEFLKAYDAEQIFLIGDIIDFWAMKNCIHWTGSQNTVIQKILRQSRHGKEVFYIPGNHDEAYATTVEQILATSGLWRNGFIGLLTEKNFSLFTGTYLIRSPISSLDYCAGGQGL